MSNKPIIGSIIERKPGPSSGGITKSRPKAFESGRTGFPAAQHRTKSAFSRGLEDSKRLPPKSGASNKAPDVVPTPPARDLGDVEGAESSWRAKMSKENEDLVAGMADEEREEERRQILERFGTNIGEVLARARRAREQNLRHAGPAPPVEVSAPDTDAIPVTSEEPVTRATRSPPPSALVSPNTSRPSSRAERRLRFAELEPKDVFVYEGAHESPKRRVLALPPPDPDSDDKPVSLGKWSGPMSFAFPADTPDTAASSATRRPVPIPEPRPPVQQATPPEEIPVIVHTPSPKQPVSIPEPQPPPEKDDEPEEGTPEYIRRRYFPQVPRGDPNMAWLESTPEAEATESAPSLRFDLQGVPIPASVSLTLPTHLGLHHHAEGAHAGYTLDDIFLLSRSTVAAQRATMLGVLARIAANLAKLESGTSVDGMQELVGKEQELRKRMVAAGLEAMSSRGTLGARAIDLVWQCVVGWNLDVVGVEGVELTSPSTTVLDSLPVQDILKQIADLLSQGGLVPESVDQLLAVLHRLAQQSNKFAEAIVNTQHLVPTIVQSFLLSTSTDPDSSGPYPAALTLLHTLVLASRANAEVINQYSDSFLRFITSLPSPDSQLQDEANQLLLYSIELYSALATYGLATNIAGAAVEPFSKLEQHVISSSCTSHALRVAWAVLVERWTTCSIDPHQTTPPHDIRWSQINGWAWSAGLGELVERLSTDEKDWGLWAAVWNAQAAYLEGSKVNSIKSGESERFVFIEANAPGLSEGKQSAVVGSAVDAVGSSLNNFHAGRGWWNKRVENAVGVLTAAIRVCVACLPSDPSAPPAPPPFPLPFTAISGLASTLVVHRVWSMWKSIEDPVQALPCRSLSGLLSSYLGLSKHLPDVSKDLYTAQSLAILLRLGPGDEDNVISILKAIGAYITPEWAAQRGFSIPPSIWERGGFSILDPFIHDTVRPQDSGIIGPLSITPLSIKSSTTQRISPCNTVGLPLRRDWTFTPLDHLLRSGESEVFRTLPSSWDASEVELTRATLLLSSVIQVILARYSLDAFHITRAEAIFNCSKVFMLEHGQTQVDSSEEVFRDTAVERFMTELLRSFEYGASSSASGDPQATTSVDDLETAAAAFLGTGTPFFQYYTDFVALYDSTSFSHPVFARLLLPPTSMRYAVDYRKHLWCDFRHILQTIRVQPQQVLSGDLREYLYPIEDNPELIGSYVAPLLKNQVHDFLKVVATHHIASNIWLDLKNERWKEDRAIRLLKTIVNQGDFGVVRDVVGYHQSPTGALLLPPACYTLGDEVKKERAEYVRKWVGNEAAERLKGLFNA